jgi:hypothetical protein
MTPTWFSRHGALATQTTLVEALVWTIQISEDIFIEWVVDLEKQHEGIESTSIASGSGVATRKNGKTRKHVRYVSKSSNIF